MSATERLAMGKMPPGREVFRNGFLHRVCAMGVGLLLLFAPARPASAQQPGRIMVSGTVSSPEGQPLAGVTVSVQGTELRAVTAPNGKYNLSNVPSDGLLSFTIVGRTPVQTSISGRTTIDVTMQRVAYLEAVVTTGYTEQRRGDITGAVGSVPVETINRETGASVLQKLAAATPGVTVEASGSPGSRSTVRIRGISSFQNNDPLYIVDGTPMQDSYVNWLNPEDITSIQVLKDASAASIYGSRASNGVILIETTKKGLMGSPHTNFRVRTGMATATRGYDDFLIQNSLDYFQVVKASFQNAGQPVPTNIYGSVTNPTVPKYIWPNDCGASGKDACNTVNLGSYSYPDNLIMPGSNGTNWWKAVFGTGKVTDANLQVSGGSPENTYGVSFSLFDQSGTAKYNEFKRGTVRANTEFRRNKLSFGENLAIGIERANGGQGDDAFGENTIIGKNILMQPIVPVRDIAGNFASGKALTLGNNTNPLKIAYEARDNITKTNRVFGNVFGGYAILPTLAFKSRFGFSVDQGSYTYYTPPTPENSEATFSNSIGENERQNNDWTWSNTATYAITYGMSTLNLLAGQEANAGNYRRIDGSLGNVVNPAVDLRYLQDGLGDARTKNVSSTGSEYALLSFFGKADYNFADRYIVSGTLRRDGSSRFAKQNQWGNFPAIGLAWHLSNESFLQNNHWLSDAMIRYGWGVTGNQQIPDGRIVSLYNGDRGTTFYDIGGTNTNIVAGYRLVSQGNANLKWEEDRSQNIGTDLALWDSRINVVFDVYRRTTNNLLFDPRLPATAGHADPPIVNIGSMRNTGFDMSVGHRSTWWDATINGSHYTNKILSIDGVSNFFYGPTTLRFSPHPVINQVGSPIGAFYGYVSEGFFRDAADVAAHATQDGAQPGRIKFKDVNHDGKITDADQTIIGSPHPKFTSGLDLNFRWRGFDLGTTIFGSFGNDILDAQKQFYIFRNFSTNVRKDLLANSWTPTHQNAKYPRLDVSDTYSSVLSSFYVEDGSYVRMRSLQLGYTIPNDMRYIGAALTGTRVYFQADNLFTITGYDGLDPALPSLNVTGAAGDIRDQSRGIDVGTYPSNRVLSIGISTTF